MLEIKKLSISGKGNTPILREVSLTIPPSARIGLTGASGSGKTTLIKSVMGMSGAELTVTGGNILLDGISLLEQSARERRRLCGKTIGFIPQNPITAFFAHTKIGKQMTETFLLHGMEDKQSAVSLAAEMLRAVNLTETERIMDAYPSQLSGGMLQRISMALILGTRPGYILADEPTSALDDPNRDILLSLLSDYEDAGILFISHDAEALKQMCSITHVMENGRMIETQATNALFISPHEPWTKSFVHAATRREGGEWQWSDWN